MYQRFFWKKCRTLLQMGVFFFVNLCNFGCFLPCKASAGQNEGKNWAEISAYTTYYNQNEGGRCENIAIATACIDGITIQAYGDFSFNQTVGKRTKEAGFQQAKIIVNGEYVMGVGGGVCQVSTTLYNAALKAGLTVTEFHPHSLRVGYIPPSRDAMVSSHSDLQFFNPHSFPVRIRATATEGALRICFLGKDEGVRYEIQSCILAEISPPAPIIREGREEGVLRAEKKGVKSEAYLEGYKGERLIFRKRLRVDEYLPIQAIIVKKNENSANKMPSNDCLF